MSMVGGYLAFVVVPTALCVGAGAYHGWRQPTTSRALLGALAVSGTTCWSIAAGGGGDMAFPALIPSWFISPLGPFVGPKDFIFPPWWLTPWLQFLAYLLAV